MLWKILKLLALVAITVGGLALVARMGTSNVFGQSATDPLPQATAQAVTEKAPGLPRAPDELINAVKAASSANESCKVFANTTPPTGSEPFKGDHLVLSYVTLTDTNCTTQAMVVDLNGAGRLIGASGPGDICFSMNDEETSALCTVQNGTVITTSFVITVTDNVVADIYSLGQPQEVWWRGLFRKIFGAFLPMIKG